MATVKTNSRFTEYTINPQEEINGGMLTFDQKTLISNDRAMVANLILNNHYDPEHPELFLQKDAHLKGQLSAYDFLIARAEEAEDIMRKIVENNRQG